VACERGKAVGLTLILDRGQFFFSEAVVKLQGTDPVSLEVGPAIVLSFLSLASFCDRSRAYHGNQFRGQICEIGRSHLHSEHRRSETDCMMAIATSRD